MNLYTRCTDTVLNRIKMHKTGEYLKVHMTFLWTCYCCFTTTSHKNQSLESFGKANFCKLFDNFSLSYSRYFRCEFCFGKPIFQQYFDMHFIHPKASHFDLVQKRHKMVNQKKFTDTALLQQIRARRKYLFLGCRERSLRERILLLDAYKTKKRELE